MTNLEAIQHIDRHNQAHQKKERFAVYITEALEMAKAALKKQVAIKPEESGVNFCPICHTVIEYDWLSPKYCSNCGQALDWEH